MKHFFRFSVMLLALLLPAHAMAADFEVDGICYNIYGNQAAVARKGLPGYLFIGYSGSVVIPATVTYNGTTYPVTSIDEFAFYRCTELTSVDIPNSVTAFGFGAFMDCPGLTSIDIPNSVTAIGRQAFMDCPGLTSIDIPNSVTEIGGYAFSGCSGLTSIVVESGNPRYDSRNNCNAIIETTDNTLIAGCKNTIIPNSVTAICYGAFYGCSGLTSIVIPNSVTAIGHFAFAWCTGLTSIDIPNSVTEIGGGVFDDCTELASIVVESGNPRYDSRNNCNAIIETADNTLIYGCKNTTIPNSVTEIGYWAFYECKGLTSIDIPNSVTSIDDGAFYSCTGLTSIVIPCSVTAIGDWAFMDCTGLTSIVIPNSVTAIGDSAFFDCWRLTDVYCYIADLSRVSSGNEQFSLNFSPNYSGRTLHVLQGTADAYRADENWYPYFGQIVEDLMTGDVDGDGSVNISDVTELINILLSGTTPPSRADVDGDGIINISDVASLINYLLSGSWD